MGIYDKDLERIDKELEMMNETQALMSEQGLTLGDYDLQSETAKLTKQREEEEKERIRRAEEAAAKGEALERGTTIIGGEVARRDIEIEEDPLASTDVIEKVYPDGGVYRVGSVAKSFDQMYEERGSKKNPLYTTAQLYARQEKGSPEYGGKFKYIPEMAQDFPELAKYQQKFGKPSQEVLQVIDKNTIVGGKPTMTLQPVVSKEQVLLDAPKQSDFVGDINYLSRHRKALEKYFKESGIKDWENVINETDKKRDIYDVQYK